MDAQSNPDTASCFSEEGEAPSVALYTCLSCQVAFKTPTDQRSHMRSDWHRYNLKRKVAELPPVSAQVFADKLELIQQKGAPAASVNASNERSNLECTTCR
jgi:pre-60S factor REI1